MGKTGGCLRTYVPGGYAHPVPHVLRSVPPSLSHVKGGARLSIGVLISRYSLDAPACEPRELRSVSERATLTPFPSPIGAPFMDTPLPEWAQHALDAALTGTAVFPLLTKHVIPVKWGREATADPEKIYEWARAFPGATGYGIALRQDTYVFDADTAEAVDWCRANMPPTYEVATGREKGGVHFYYHVPDGRRLRMLNTRLGEVLGGVPGLDGKTAGGYVVGPGSYHASGRQYYVATYADPAVMPRPVADRIGDRPAAPEYGKDDGLTDAERTEFAANGVWGSALRAEAISDALAIKRQLTAYLHVSDERWSDAFLEASIRLGIHVPSGAISYYEAVAFMEQIFVDEDNWGTEGNVRRSIRRGIAYGARQEKKSWL